jgi:hypothetical protein
MTFKSAFFNEDNTTMAVAARTLNDIATSIYRRIGATSYMAEISRHQ